MKRLDEKTILDVDSLLERYGKKPVFLGKLSEAFTEDSARRLNRISQAIDEDDWSAAAQAAHGLKGGASVVGADQVIGVAKLLQQAAGDGREGDVVTLLEKLRREVDQADKALQEVLSRVLAEQEDRG